MYRVRRAGDEDRTFVIEMPRLASTLNDRALPDADAPEVIASLPPSPAAAVVASDHAGQALRAVWWHLDQPSMLHMLDGSSIAELTMAVRNSATVSRGCCASKTATSSVPTRARCRASSPTTPR